MAVSLAELIITCLLVDWVFRKVKVPGLIGMLLVGIAFGPYVLGVVDENLLAVSADLRLIALIVILLRAGFELSKDTLSRVGLMALLLSFVPACFEIAVITLLGPYFLGLTTMESAILGAILGAVSPAVVVPLMIRFIEERRGAQKGIPTLVLAASSIDDVFVIVVYSILIGIYLGHDVPILWELLRIPFSIASGIVVGLAIGWLLYQLFDRYNPRATKRVLVILGIAILLVRGEHLLENIVPFSALIAVMAVGFIILEKREHYAHEMSARLGKIWIFAEILLFTLVGAQVDVGVALQSGLAGIALISLGLVGRSIGTYLCMLGSDLNLKERLFVVIAYLPKATVQAAIGAAPLAAMKVAGMNTVPGDMILTLAVVSILYTAPLGAWAISLVGERVLEVGPEGMDASRKAAIESEARADGGLLS
jgi:NhaP-type Na+/H+ or K+/H+ antiporter